MHDKERNETNEVSMRVVSRSSLLSISLVLKRDDTIAVLVEETTMSGGSMTGQVGIACAPGGRGSIEQNAINWREHGHDSRCRRREISSVKVVRGDSQQFIAVAEGEWQHSHQVFQSLCTRTNRNLKSDTAHPE